MNDELQIMNYNVPEGPLFQFLINHSSLIIIILVWVLSGCGAGTETAGSSGSGGETIELSGIIAANGSYSAEGAIVTLYPRNYDPRMNVPVPDSLIDTADIEGTYKFTNIDTGQYNVQAVNGEGKVYALAQNVDVQEIRDTTIYVPEITLRAPGTIQISVRDSGMREGGYVYIPGTDVSALLTEKDMTVGQVQVDNVPAAAYSEILYKDSLKAYNVIEEMLEVKPDSTSIVSPFRTWMFTGKIGINTTSAGVDVQTDLYNFPLLVRLDSGNFNFADSHGEGEDLRFSKPDGTPLSFEIERWDTLSAAAEVWVKLDTIFGNNDKQYFFMYWGKASVANESEGGNVFDTANGFSGVWHLEEKGSELPDGYTDATVSDEHGSGVSMDASSRVPAVVGLGQEFDGKNDYIDMGASTGLDGASELTISFWCLADTISFPSIAGLFSRGSSSQRAPRIYGVRGQDYLLFRMETPDGAFDGEVMTSSLTQGNWHYVTFTWDGMVVTSYVDAVPGAVDSTSGTELAATDGTNFIGNLSDGGFWDGQLDEMRTSRKTRSADWVKLCYENQKAGSKVVTINITE
ncbi:MAG: DUF2341 domain-containing protein [Fibrobacteria bacterium]|nr:DUF2341 domain-containing protein [Fibrobacteria bacterium]